MMNNMKLIEIIRNAAGDYLEHLGSQTPSEWLQDYLGRNLRSKSVEAVHAISGEILETLDLMEKKKAAMNAAKAAGQSAEQWLVSDIMQEKGGNGEKARKAAQFLNSIVRSKAELENVEDVEIIDIEEDAEWQDDKWNDYRLKDTLKNVAKEAGQCGLREIAADVFAKASEDGLAAVIEDKDFVTDTLMDGANVGLKVALSAGLAVAEDSGIIPPTSFHVLATIAHKTVESFSAFKDVIKGRRSLTDALIHIKDTAVSTFSGLWAKHGTAIREEIVDTVGAVFGMKGAVIAGAIHGALMKNTEESKFVTVIKEAGKAAVRFFTKEIKLPFFNKTKALQLNMNDA